MCIDATEVTTAHYAPFLADPEARKIPRVIECQADTSDVPDVSCMANPRVCKGPDCANHPQVCIPFCSARAFCTWAGKTLCGADRWTKETASDSPKWGWANACGNGIAPNGLPAQSYPYGPKRDPSACNGPEGKKPTTTVPVASMKSCQGERDYARVFDLAGNAGEWVELTGDPRSGHYAGGSFDGTGAVVDPEDCIPGSTASLNLSLFDVGFRCCAP